MALFLVVACVQLVTGHDTGFSVLNFDDPVCVTADAGPIGVRGTDADPLTGDEFPQVSDRGSTTTSSYLVCLDRPSFGEQVAGSIDGLLDVILAIGAAWGVRRTIRIARRQGLFTAASARATRRVGWFLVAMSVLSPAAAAIGNGIVVAAAVPSQHWTTELSHGFLPVTLLLLLTGLGVLSFARILRLAVPLQEEAELTV